MKAQLQVLAQIKNHLHSQVITPFKKHCAANDHYYRRCPSTKQPQCIRRELFCDGQVNCGGDEKDEQIEYCLTHPGVDMFMTIPIVVFSIVGLMFVLFLIKMCASRLKPKRRADRRLDRASGHRQVFYAVDGGVDDNDGDDGESQLVPFLYLPG